MAYRSAWASPAVRLVEIRDLAVHATSDPDVIVAEWQAEARRPDETEFTLSGVLVLRARDGLLIHVRDYMDVLGLAPRTGRPGGTRRESRARRLVDPTTAVLTPGTSPKHSSTVRALSRSQHQFFVQVGQRSATIFRVHPAPPRRSIIIPSACPGQEHPRKGAGDS